MRGKDGIYQSVGHKPHIVQYDGKEGLYAALVDLCNTAPYLKSFASPSNFLNVLTRKQATRMVQIMEKRNIRSTTLTSSSEKSVEIASTFTSPNLEWRTMPADIKYPIEITFTKRKVLLISWSHLFAILVESEDVSLFIESIYDYFWDRAIHVQK